MQYWLMKSEPNCYSIDDLKKAKVDCWDGVRNYQVRNMIRDEMEVGDLAFFYHSNAKPPCIVGVAEIASEAYPDHTAFEPSEKHFDPKSDPENPRWLMVDVKFKKKFKTPLGLDEMRNIPALSEMKLLQKGSRLSITPVSKKDWNAILKIVD